LRRLMIASLSLALLLSAFAMSPVAAGGCVKFVASQFDAPGNDNLNLNAEWVRIKNLCATGKSLSGWRIHDYNRNHTYTFQSGVRLGVGKTITLFTGHGTDASNKKYWDKSGAVWNNDPPEYAYLKKADGTLMSRWTE